LENYSIKSLIPTVLFLCLCVLSANTSAQDVERYLVPQEARETLVEMKANVHHGSAGGDFTVDLSRTEQLAARIPSPVAVISESGIRSPQDALRMRKAGADAVLVGQSLAEREGAGLAELQCAAPRGHRR
jgi:tRNA-dihydrouridine synthase